MIDKFKIYSSIIDLLEKGGMTKKYPFVMEAVKRFHEYGYTLSLDHILKKYPQILHQAKRNVLEQKEYPFWPPPYKKRDLEKLKGKYDIGIINNYGDKVYLSPNDLIRIFFISGSIGSGKSYPLLRLLYQILSTPIEERGFNVLIIQAVKRDADFLIKHNKDLIILEWEDIRRAPFYVEWWNTAKAKDKSFINAFSAVNWHLKLGEILITTVITMCRNMFGNNLNFTQLYNHVEKAAETIGLIGHSYKDVIDSVKFSLYAFKETGNVLDCKKGLTISEFFTKKDIILNVKEETNNYLLMTFLIDLLADISRYHSLNSPNNKLNTLVFGDESRRIIPSSQKDSKTGHDPSEPVKQLVTSTRSDGIGWVFATQEISSAPEYLTSNAAYKLAMLVTGKGRKDAQEILNLTKEQASFMDKFPKYGVGMMSYLGFDRRFIVSIPDDLDDTLMSRNDVRELMDDKIAELHKPIEETIRNEIQNLKDEESKRIENEKIKKETIKKFSLKEEKKRIQNKLNGIKIIEYLSNEKNDPFIPYTPLSDILNITHSKMRDAVDNLNEKHFSVSVKCIGPKGKLVEYIALTENVNELLSKKAKIINPAHFKHSLYKDRVSSFLKFKGHETIVEYPDDTKKAFIDVLAIEAETNQRIAYEITLSFSNLKTNIQKCETLFNIEMANIHIVTETKEDRTKAMNLTAKAFPKSVMAIKFDLINDFLIKK